MSVPSNEIEPEVTGVSRRIMRPIVVLPLPLSPMSETISPGAIAKLTSRTATSCDPPNVPTW